MKENIIYWLLALSSALFWSCKEDALGPSVIQDETENMTAMDQWLYDNFTKPYNIRIYYKLKDYDTDADNYAYNIVPADPAKSFALAQIIKYFWAGTFEEYLSPEFVMANGFREMQFEGTYRYKQSSYTKATAAAGIRIVFCGVNNLNLNNIKNVDDIIDSYVRTMYHENTHILNQKKPYSADFVNINGADYLGSDWTTRTDAQAQQLGFVDSYAGESAGEDFAQIVAYYITRRAQWNAAVANAGAEGADKMNSKLSIVMDYMKDAWGIDMDALRELFEQRAAAFSNYEIINY